MNLMTLLLSIPILVMAAWLYNAKGSECYTFLQKPVIFVGIAIFVLSLVGCIGAIKSWSWLLWIYLFLMAILIMLLAAFTLFAFIVTAPGGGTTIGAYKYKEYNLGDYSVWLQDQINSTSGWRTLRSCMVDDQFCDHLSKDFLTVAEIQNASLTPLESGCCRPPVGCGFPQTNITTFTIPVSTFTIPDCGRWSNNASVMCYNCDSCKGGVAQYVREEWQVVSFVMLAVVLLLSFLYCVGCCARYNAGQAEFEDMEKERFAPDSSSSYPSRAPVPPPGFQRGAQPGYQRQY